MGDKRMWLSTGSFFGTWSVQRFIQGLIVFVLAIGCLIGWGTFVDHHWSAQLQTGSIWRGLIYVAIWLFVSVRVFEPPIDYVFKLASATGCYGVQVLLTSRALRCLAADPRYYVDKASQYGLRIKYHQPWDILDFASRFLIKWRYLPKPQRVLNSVLTVLRLAKEKNIGQVAVHSNLWSQIPEELRQYVSVEPVDTTPIKPDNLTCLIFDVGYSLCQDYRVCHSWVFSHADGWRDEAKIINLWRDWWEKYGRWCREIHIYDILPGAGRQSKNRLPGTGRLPLKELRNILDGSDKTTPGAIDIVLELNPLQLLMHQEPKIREAITFVRSCFVL